MRRIPAIAGHLAIHLPPSTGHPTEETRAAAVTATGGTGLSAPGLTGYTGFLFTETGGVAAPAVSYVVTGTVSLQSMPPPPGGGGSSLPPPPSNDPFLPPPTGTPGAPPTFP